MQVSTPSQRQLFLVTTSSPRLLRANAPSVKCQTLKSVVHKIVAALVVAHVVAADAPLVDHDANSVTVTTVAHVVAMIALVSTVMIVAHAMTAHVSTVTTAVHALATIVVQRAPVVANSVIASSAPTTVQHATTAHVSIVMIVAHAAAMIALVSTATIVRLAAVTIALVSTATTSATTVHHVHAMIDQHVIVMIVLHAVTTEPHVDLAAQARAHVLALAETPLVAARSQHAVTNTHE